MHMLPKLSRLPNGSTLIFRSGLIVTAVVLWSVPTLQGVAQIPDSAKPHSDRQAEKGKPVDRKGLSDKVPHPKQAVRSPATDSKTAAAPAGDTGAPSIEYLPRPTASEQRIVAALEHPTAFSFEDTPLAEVVKQIAEQESINIVFDHSEGVEMISEIKQVRIGLRVRDVSLKNALKLILDVADSTWVIEDEVLKILPKSAATKHAVTRIYPVQDLVGEQPDFESLISAVHQSVARGTWTTLNADGRPVEINPKAIGGISKVPASGSLVVHHNPQVHDQVLELLRGLREAKELNGNQNASAYFLSPAE